MGPPAHPEIEAYDRGLVARLRSLLGVRLLAVYATGSTALGDYVPGASDIDRMVVVQSSIGETAKAAIAESLRHENFPCPARGLELVVYNGSVLDTPTPGGAFELNLNTGAHMPFHTAYDPDEEPGHWFVLDRAIAREHGEALYGAAPQDLISPIPREWLLGALLDSFVWHRENEVEEGANAVLAACRAWVFAEQNRWASKREAVEWAMPRMDVPEIAEAALELHGG
jgi:hypothetical protein